MSRTDKTIPPQKRRSGGKNTRKNNSVKVVEAYSLPESLTMKNVESVAAELRQIGFECAIHGINASATHIITTAGIQLLMALDASLKTAGNGLHLIQAKEELGSSFRSLGLEAVWKTWTQPAATEKGAKHEQNNSCRG